MSQAVASVEDKLALALAEASLPAHLPRHPATLLRSTPARDGMAESAAGDALSEPGRAPEAVSEAAGAGSAAPALTVTPDGLPGKDGRRPPPPGGGFELSWSAGETDDAGNRTGGTELMNLVVHDGKLFAGTSVWKDTPGDDPVLGAQVLRLDGPADHWQVDLNLSELMPDGTPRYLRLGALTSVTFTTDIHGQPLSPPVSRLLASPADNAGTLSVFSRDDATGTWTETDVFQAGIPAGFRSFGFHHDAITHVDRVFAGTGIFGIFNGAYDPTVPGGIRWNPVPQVIGHNRPLAFAEANGILYVAMDPGLYMHVDGVLAHWQVVYQFDPPPYGVDGLRGLTAVPNPSGAGDVLLESLEGDLGYVGYIDPAAGYGVTTEMNFLPYFVQHWGGLHDPYVVAAYNDMTPVQDPQTGEPLVLIGLEAQSASAAQRHSTWYLVRHADGGYDLHEIPPIATPEDPNPNLFGTRTIVISPFPEDKGQVVYFGGHDATWDQSPHDTAWIYRAPLTTALGE